MTKKDARMVYEVTIATERMVPESWVVHSPTCHVIDLLRVYSRNPDPLPQAYKRGAAQTDHRILLVIFSLTCFRWILWLKILSRKSQRLAMRVFSSTPDLFTSPWPSSTASCPILNTSIFFVCISSKGWKETLVQKIEQTTWNMERPTTAVEFKQSNKYSK